MPRSNAAPSDHSSDRRRDSLHPDFPEQDITDSECGTEPDSDPESLSEGHPGVLEYQNIMLQEVCWFHRSAAIYLEAPDRRTSGARIAAMRMQQHNMDADDILRIALPQLEPEPSGSLQRDYQYMATALRRQLPRNDRQWIRSTVMREELLTRQQVSQALCLLLVRELWPISPMPRWLRPDILPDWLSMWPSLCYTSRCYWPSGPFSLEWLKDACRGGIYNMNNTGNYTLPCRSSMSTPTSLTTSSLSPLPRRSTMRTRCSKSPPAPLLVCLGHLSHPAPLVCRGHLSHPAPQVYRDRRLWRRWRFRTSVAPARRRRRSKHCRASMLSSGLVQIFRSWHRQAAGYHEFPIHTGRPGPKSGISVWRTPMANDSTEDARVGTSEGRRVPEAPYSAMHSPYMAKPDDHTSTQVKSKE